MLVELDGKCMSNSKGYGILPYPLFGNAIIRLNME